MSVSYVAVQWSRHKRVYDAVIAAAILIYLSLFIGIGKTLYSGGRTISDEILVIRALGSCAFVLLHVILCIGPLARLDRRFLPLLYNRRHLGVATFVVALAHGGFATAWYHGFGNVNPLISLLTSNTQFLSLRSFPFQLLGAAALLILFIMAATSHDFWNRNLGPRWWKTLHMLVYVAYGLLVMHVVLGALQTQRVPTLAGIVIAGAALVVILHLITGRREIERDLSAAPAISNSEATWLDAGSPQDIPDGRARIVVPPQGERIAVFRYQGCVSAVTNVCAHQGGPLGEGKVIDGCMTCPWHGWQYRPGDGQSPPPFTERIATYRVRLHGDRIQVDPQPLPPGTPVAPARIEESPS